MPSLDGQFALITGAASGIGRATAELFAREGAHVFVADVNVAAAQSVAAMIQAKGQGGEVIKLDVASESDWDAALSVVSKRATQLDFLINCAGIAAAEPIPQTSLAEWHRLHAVNLDSVFLGTRAGMRMMAGRGGAIVNVASLSGVEVFPGAATYSSSKAAVVHFSRCAAAECAQCGNNVRVSVVVPGGVRTPMWSTVPQWAELAKQDEEKAWRAVDPAGEFYSADEVAQEIMRLALDPSPQANGRVHLLNGSVRS